MFEKDLKPWIQKLDNLDRMRDNMYTQMYIYEKNMLNQRQQLNKEKYCQIQRKQRIQIKTAEDILNQRTQHPTEMRFAIEDIVDFQQTQKQIQQRLANRQKEREYIKEQQTKTNTWKPSNLQIPEAKMDWRTTRKLRQLQTKRNQILLKIDDENRRFGPKNSRRQIH